MPRVTTLSYSTFNEYGEPAAKFVGVFSTPRKALEFIEETDDRELMVFMPKSGNKLPLNCDRLHAALNGTDYAAVYDNNDKAYTFRRTNLNEGIDRHAEAREPDGFYIPEDNPTEETDL